MAGSAKRLKRVEHVEPRHYPYVRYRRSAPPTPPLRPRQSWRQARAPISKAQAADEWIAGFASFRGTLKLVVASLLAAVIVAVILGVQDYDQRAFDHAPVCSSSVTANCKTELTVTIQDKGRTGQTNTGQPSGGYYLLLSGPAPANSQVYLPNDTPLWYAAGVGQVVTAVVWHGAVVNIVDGEVTGDTNSAPAVNVMLLAGLLTVALAWSAAFAVVAARLREVERGRGQGWSRQLRPWITPATVALAAFPLSAWIGIELDSFLTALFLGLGITAAVAAYQYRDLSRKE